MISTDELKENVRKFIISKSFPKISELDDNAMIFDEGILDSMGFMSLITHLESNLKVRFEDLDLLETNFESVNAISNFVLAKLANREVN